VNKMVDIADVCPEWTNDERMNVLFAPLRKKELNPDSWHSKVKFWTNLIEKWSLESSTIVFDVSDLKRIFSRNGKSPYCLLDVLEEGVLGGAFVQPEKYLQGLRAPHQTWGSWALGLGSSAVKTVGTKVFGGSVNSVLVPSVAEAIKTEIYEALLKCDRFIPSTRLSYLTEVQVTSVLSHLKHEPSRQFSLQVLIEEKKLAKFTLDKQTFYKIATEDTADVNEVDKGLIHLKINLDHLAAQIPTIEASIQHEKNSAKNHLKCGSRQSAKNALRRQKRLETRLDKLHSQQLNLEHIYEELISAETNNKIIQAYDAGLSAMKKLVDVSVLDSAEETMSHLAEIIDINAQVSETISNQTDVEFGDLEKELEDLLQDDAQMIDGTKTEGSSASDRVGPSGSKFGPCLSKSDTGKRSNDVTDAGLDVDLETALNNLDKLDMNDLQPIIGAKKAKISSLAS